MSSIYQYRSILRLFSDLRIYMIFLWSLSTPKSQTSFSPTPSPFIQMQIIIARLWTLLAVLRFSKSSLLTNFYRHFLTPFEAIKIVMLLFYLNKTFINASSSFSYRVSITFGILYNGFSIIFFSIYLTDNSLFYSYFLISSSFGSSFSFSSFNWA